MKLRFGSTLALVFGIAGVSHAAQTITSPALPTVTNTAAACYLRNVGTRPVSVQLMALTNFTPGITTPSFENCNEAPLAPGKSCVLLMNDLDDDVNFACTAAVSGSARDVRGAVEIRQITAGGLRVVLSADLQ